MNKTVRRATLYLSAILVCLAMLRLGVWQLGRAEEKQLLLNQQNALAELAPVDLADLMTRSEGVELPRYRSVSAQIQYKPEATVYVDNQVFDTKVGYQVFTPAKVEGTEYWVLVNRGWIAVGANRQNLPELKTLEETHSIVGRMNQAPPQPPLWNDEAPVASGQLWQYLPVSDFAQQWQIELLPMVVELPPEFEAEADSRLQRRWQRIDDIWVAKHNAYAFQWFAMAAAFLVACVVVALRSARGS